MKTLSSKTWLAALALGTTMTAVQAGDSPWVWPEDKPQPLMLAQDGSDRLMDQHLRRQAIDNQRRRDTSERLIRMLEEQPTAAGSPAEKPAVPQTEQEKIDDSSMNRSPLQPERDLYE